MIFGKTYQEKKQTEQVSKARDVMGRRRFALFPKSLGDGRWVWLQTYYKFKRLFYTDDSGTIETIQKWIFCTPEEYKQHEYRKANIQPLRSHQEYTLSMMAMGQPPQSVSKWKEKVEWAKSLSGGENNILS